MPSSMLYGCVGTRSLLLSRNAFDRLIAAVRTKFKNICCEIQRKLRASLWISHNAYRYAFDLIPENAKKLLCLYCLLDELPDHEVRHDVVGLDGLGQGRIVPEGVRKSIEEDEACIDARA